jgi:uncharacterized membrane protein
MIETIHRMLFPAIDGLRLAIEVAGVLVVGIGFVVTVVRLAREPLLGPAGTHAATRIDLGRFLSMALEFQLAADIVSTTTAPTFEELAKLGATAAIRTGLNYFLAREQREQREQREAHETHPARG